MYFDHGMILSSSIFPMSGDIFPETSRLIFASSGCDAVNTLMTSLGVCTVVQAGPTFTTVMCVIIAQLVFFCATMEEYWSGELILPVFNGPNEVC
jgi:hypothetical protein